MNGNLISALRNMADDIGNIGASPFTVDLTLIQLAIAALEPQWQQIETAPKDGTRLMLWDSRAGGYAVTGAWVAGSADDHETITHWQLLPAAPEASE